MVARLALRSASRIVLTAALRTASIGASRTASRIVVKSWGPRAGGRVEPSQEARPSQVRGRAEPGVEMLEAWTWAWAWRVCTGNWLEMSGVVVAIGCIVYECLEHGSIFMQLLCLVIESGCYKVCMLILFRCASEDCRGS